MSLSKEILLKLLEKEDIHVKIEDFDLVIAEAFESECFKALQKIQAIIKNNGLSDFECIEDIICVFEALGSNGGGRHDSNCT